MYPQLSLRILHLCTIDCLRRSCVGPWSFERYLSGVLPVNKSLSAEAARGGLVVVFGQVLKLIVQMLGLIVLSRILSPLDFGLIAMVGVFVGLGDLLRDFGMPTAALRVSVLTEGQASNFFWVNCLMGLTAAVGICALTPVAIWFYGEPRLSMIMPLLSVGPLLNGVQAQHQVRLAREMRFAAIAISDVAAQVVGLMIAIVMGLLGSGYWALVGQALAVSSCLLLMRVLLTRWVPRFPSRGEGSRAQVRSGWHFGLAQLLTYLAGNADVFMISARMGASSAGLYNRAFQILSVPVNALLSPLTQVVVPVVNRARDEGDSAARVLLKVQSVIGFAGSMVFVVVASSADSLVPLLLGGQWHESAALLQLLSIGGCVQLFSFVSYWGFILTGRSRDLLWYNCVTKPLAVGLVVIGSSFGLKGVALGYSLGLVVSWPINLVWLKRRAGFPASRFFVDGMISLGGALGAFASARLLLAISGIDGELGRTAVAMLASGVAFATLALCRGSVRSSLAAARSMIVFRLEGFSQR